MTELLLVERLPLLYEPILLDGEIIAEQQMKTRHMILRIQVD